MVALHIRDVPESTVAELRERARRDGVSMQAVLRRVLNDAVAVPHRAPQLDPIELTTTRTSGEAGWRREDIYGDEGR